MPENTLAGGKEDIGGNEPADFGVIVPALDSSVLNIAFLKNMVCSATGK